MFSQFKYKNKLYNSLKCKKCGFIQTKPVHENAIDIYETGHYKVKPYFLFPFLINLPNYFNIYVLFKKHRISKNKKILDFGCGKGYFLYFLKKLGFKELVGVETSSSRASYSNKLTQLSILSETYSSGKIMQRTYDCITLIHVLEHIENPFNILNILIDQALNRGGVLFIEVPNINSLSSKIGGKIWAHFTPHFHINHFTQMALTNYCSENGFKYELESTFSFYNSSMGMTSAFLKLMGYKGVLFEDMKNKKISIIFLYILLLPFSIYAEIICSFFQKGSVIKLIVKKQ